MNANRNWLKELKEEKNQISYINTIVWTEQTTHYVKTTAGTRNNTQFCRNSLYNRCSVEIH